MTDKQLMQRFGQRQFRKDFVRSPTRLLAQLRQHVHFDNPGSHMRDWMVDHIRTKLVYARSQRRVRADKSRTVGAKVSRSPAGTHLLGHHEVMGFRKHAYYVERDPKYTNQKPDPGPRFMQRVRARVAELKLSGPSS